MFFFRSFIFIVSIAFIFFSCSEKKKDVKRPVIEMKEYKPLIIEGEDGQYTEWYPGHKQVKITGRKNSSGERVGIWKYYSEDGIELSVSVYNNNGERDGHIIVRYPNGVLHYIGEYRNGEKAGEWEFYEPNGDLARVENFSK